MPNEKFKKELVDKNPINNNDVDINTSQLICDK